MQLVHYEGKHFAINDLINAVTVNLSPQLITTQPCNYKLYCNKSWKLFNENM